MRASRIPVLLVVALVALLPLVPTSAAGAGVVCSAGLPVTCAYPSLEALGASCEWKAGVWTCTVIWRVDMDASGLLPCIHFGTNVRLGAVQCGTAAVAYGDQEGVDYVNAGPGFRTVTATGSFCVSTNHAFEQCIDLRADFQIPPSPGDNPGTEDVRRKVRAVVEVDP